MPEKYHLRALARGGEKAVGQGPFREELFRLQRFGLLEEVAPQRIGDIFDGKEILTQNYVRLTDAGRQFLLDLDSIDRS